MLHWRSLPLLHFQRVNVLLLMLSSNSRWLLQKLLCLATAVLATGWWPGKFVIFCERSEHSPEASPEVSLAFSFFRFARILVFFRFFCERSEHPPETSHPPETPHPPKASHLPKASHPRFFFASLAFSIFSLRSKSRNQQTWQKNLKTLCSVGLRPTSLRFR